MLPPSKKRSIVAVSANLPFIVDPAGTETHRIARYNPRKMNNIQMPNSLTDMESDRSKRLGGVGRTVKEIRVPSPRIPKSWVAV